jgi:hypothetical protein
MRATGDDGTEILAMGITRQNVEYLKKGRPIRVEAESHPGFPEKLKILIFYGENERVLAESVKTVIGADTKVIAVPRETGGDLPKDVILARPDRHHGTDEHGMPLDLPQETLRDEANRVTREGDLIAAMLQTPNGEMAFQVFGEPSVKLLEALDQARGGYRAVLERLGLLKPEGTKH